MQAGDWQSPGRTDAWTDCARNYLRDEPGGRRFFVNDQNGPLYILDKQTKPFTTYLDFNGLTGRPGLFRRFTCERDLATGLISFVFDPDYARIGLMHTVHMEDPTTDATAEPVAGAVAGLDLSGYTTTAAVAGHRARDVPRARRRGTAGRRMRGSAVRRGRERRAVPAHQERRRDPPTGGQARTVTLAAMRHLGFISGMGDRLLPSTV